VTRRAAILQGFEDGQIDISEAGDTDNAIGASTLIALDEECSAVAAQ
jgi:hypothetical protein